MTTSTESDRTPWWRFFGPWPLQPLPVAAIVGLMSIALGLDPGPWIEQWPVALAGSAVGVLIWAILSAASRWVSNLVMRPVGYVGLFVLLAVAVTSVREFVDVIPGTIEPAPRIVVISIVTTLFFILVQGILGTASARLSREMSRANRAIVQLQEQQTALLRADESVREQVALVLHDQVQAGLVSACLRLQAVRSDPQAEAEHHQAITEIIHQLEQLRALDLRRAVRSLSPNLQDVDMATALEDLAETWAPGMDIEVVVEGKVPKTTT
jgi:Signal transduction histidine kinase